MCQPALPDRGLTLQSSNNLTVFHNLKDQGVIKISKAAGVWGHNLVWIRIEGECLFSAALGKTQRDLGKQQQLKEGRGSGLRLSATLDHHPRSNNPSCHP